MSSPDGMCGRCRHPLRGHLIDRVGGGCMEIRCHCTVSGDKPPALAQAAAGSSNWCPDCHVPPSAPHEDGCDVARCVRTGRQRLTCARPSGHLCGFNVWSGQWPGLREAERYGVDLNTLMNSGRFAWDSRLLEWVITSA